ncbi:hypothetical protein B7494_g2139 [Chlorociboria aeruginascens]|nr:hypothetical protein B7494_g2139 [Chlorociboria aeruginascens]
MAIPRSEYLSDVWRNGIFDNKVVFCTGGAGTICSAQVRALVHLGANACIIGRNVEKTESMAKDIATARSGAKVIGIGAVDVRSMQSLESAVERCVKELGGIDYAIAGAAGNFVAPISALSSNAFRTVLEIDTLGSFHTLKATLPHLLKSAAKNPNTGKNPSSGGRIVFLSATFHFVGMPLQAHASVAKAGVDALSATAALEYGPRGLTSNIITPGPIAGTEGMERLGSRESEDSGDSFKKVPLGRFGTVKEIADGTVFLFSDAGNFVNGEVLVIDGGDWSLGGLQRQYPDYLLDNSFANRRKDKAKL